LPCTSAAGNTTASTTCSIVLAVRPCRRPRRAPVPPETLLPPRCLRRRPRRAPAPCIQAVVLAI
jgi:hypothetical protein